MTSQVDRLRKIPAIRRILHMVRGKNYRQCSGVYPTFEQAQASIPSSKKVGYDHEDVAEMYSDRLDTTLPTDYAVFHWLKPLLPDIRSVFDFGGNLGWSYYSFQNYLEFGDHLRWIICDVPAVVTAGRELASRRRAERLEFTTQFQVAEGSDVLLSSGTLQYVAPGLAEMIGGLRSRPRHLLINRTPLTEAPTFFTVQDIGLSKCPYHVHNRRKFVDSLATLGYDAVDSWECYESTCTVRGRRTLTLDHYMGFYFRLGG